MNEASILVVEDEPSIAEVVDLYLRRAGYKVEVARDGDAAVEAIQRRMPDLVVLDIMLPHIDGYEITHWLRDQSEVPIIMLTARRGEADRIAGLEMGADENSIAFADLHINPKTRLVKVQEEEKSLTAKEFELLWLLARHPRQVFTRQQLLENIWGISDFIDPGTVTVHVRRLREKIEADPSNPEYIKTVWGVGYKFEP
ncbi:MAG: response regulator transcription factor [Anaerolineales bacterium]